MKIQLEIIGAADTTGGNRGGKRGRGGKPTHGGKWWKDCENRHGHPKTSETARHWQRVRFSLLLR